MALFTDIEHSAATYGISIQGMIDEVTDDDGSMYWEFQGVNYKEAESKPRSYRAEKNEDGGYRIRQIRKRGSVTV